MNFEIVSPILGFEDIKELKLEKLDDNFALLRAPNGINWSLVNPYVLREYSFSLPVSAQALLDLKEDSKIEVYCMMILQSPLEYSKVNFLAPLIFNITNNKVLQALFRADEYPEFVKLEALKQFCK